MKAHPLARVSFAAWLVLTVAVARVTAEPTGITRYDLRVDARSQGSGKASLEIVLDPIDGAVAVIPFPFADVLNPTLSGVPGAGLSTVPANGQTHFIVSLPAGTAAPLTLRFNAELAEVLSGTPPTSRGVRVALLNSQPATIRDLRFVVVFPEGLRGHAILESLPRPGKAEVEPRASFVAIDGRGGVRLQSGAIAQGETALLRVELADASPSPGWLLIGILLALFYLASFRDLVGRAAPTPENRGTP